METMERLRKLSIGHRLLLTAATSLILAAVVGLAVLFATPAGLGPQGVTLWFLLAFVALSGWLILILYGGKTYLHLHESPQTRWQYSWRQGWLLGAWVTLVAGLSSLRQLTLRDALLLVVLLLLIELYARLRQPA